MQCGFDHLISVIPESSLEIKALAGQSGMDENGISATIGNGLCCLPVALGHTSASLAAQAVTNLLAQRPDLTHRIKAVVLAHSMPIAAASGVDLLASSLQVGSLEGQPAVVVSGQPCAILHGAIQLARTWLSGLSPEDGVLVIGVDVANHLEERFFFNSAMGDAAIAGVLSRNATNHLILASITETHVMACNGEFSDEAAISRFRAGNPTAIRAVIEHCLAAAGVDLDQVSLIVPHTPNNLIWAAVAELLRFPRERILTDYIGETGHMNSNDSFAHFLRAIHEHRLVGGDLALLVNPGFGGTRGCTLLQV